MSRKKKRHNSPESQQPEKETPEGDDEREDVQSGPERDEQRIERREFSGPKMIDEPLRVAFTRAAYAEAINHAKEDLEREVCGVLVGAFCEDDEGLHVSVEGALRGAAAKAGGTHVTFTQETWNAIYEEKDEKYPKLQIVGWYHSHPGFGVSFSSHDVFIQENFFSAKGQVAFVTDPLGGEEAICVNTPEGLSTIRTTRYRCERRLSWIH